MFLPSWRFFDDATTGTVLKVRVTRPGEAPGAWVEVLPPPVRRPWHVLWNPEGNRTLAAYSLVERFLQDAGEEGRSSETSYALVCALARAELARRGEVAPGSGYEFKVCDRLPSGDEDLAVSGALAW
jgi:hypothetical protein